MDIKRIPVFVYPSTLNFYLNARQTHKQLLTLYNPYDFPVRFKVLCNASNKYTVIDPEGSIGPRACVDIVIRHIFPIAANSNVVDKFRIAMLDHVTKETIGKRDIESRLCPGEPDTNSNDGGDNFQSVSTDERAAEMERLPPRTKRIASGNTIVILVALVSIFGLFLPTTEIKEASIFPQYLCISLSLKLILSYLLGIVSFILFTKT